jgi:hypothetical protein
MSEVKSEEEREEEKVGGTSGLQAPYDPNHLVNANARHLIFTLFMAQ